MEILVSLVILATVFIASMQAISYYVRMSYSSYNVNYAAMLSQDIMARIFLTRYGAGVGEGTTRCTKTDFFWKVDKVDVSNLESQYRVDIKWNEHGTEKNVCFYTGTAKQQ